MSSNSMAPSTPNHDEVQRAINLFLILGVFGSYPMTVLVVYIIRTCYRELAKRLLTPEDIETGRYLPQAMQGQGRGLPRPMVPTGSVVVYKNITQETEAAANCSNECPICLEEFKGGDRCRILSKCKHLYHIWCIDRWVLKDLHCPLCRCSLSTHGPTAA